MSGRARALSFVSDLLADIRAETERVAPYRAIVTGVPSTPDGRVWITRVGSTQSVKATRVLGFALEVDDEVLVAPLGSFPVVVGKIGRAAPVGYALDAPLTSLVIASDHTGSATTASTTDTVNYQEAFSLDVVLPAGTWTLRSLGGLNLMHSGGGTGRMLLETDGVIGVGITSPSLSSTVSTHLIARDVETGVAGARTVTVKSKYRAQTAGTVSAASPWIECIAMRTA